MLSAYTMQLSSSLSLQESHQLSSVGRQQAWHWPVAPWIQITSSTKPSAGNRHNPDSNPGAPLPQVERIYYQLSNPLSQRPTGQLGCGHRSGSHLLTTCVDIFLYHPEVAQDLISHDRHGLNSTGFAPESGVSMLTCGGGAYPRAQLVNVERSSRLLTTSSPSAPSIALQTSTMA